VEATLVLALGAPVAMALLGTASPLRRHTPWMAVFAALPALFCALTVPIGATVELPWLMLKSRFALDATGKHFLLFTSLLWLFSAVFAAGYMADDRKRFRFFLGFLLAMGGNFGLVLAMDMLSFLVAFALMSFASYSLVVHLQDADAVRSGRVYISLVVIGEIILFSALILHVGTGGDVNLQTLEGVLTTPSVAVLLVIGFGIKVGAVLLHVWLPLAHTVAPTPASAVLSGSMIKAGLIGWIRFLPPEAEGAAMWGAVFLVAGIIGAFYGILIGLAQKHPKTVLAYSSISQMGLITVAFGIWLTLGNAVPSVAVCVLLYAFHHSLAKGALFLGVGVVGGIERQSRNRRMATAALGVAASALAGVPLTTGALAKAALKNAMVQLPANWEGLLAVLLPLSAIGTTILMGRFFYTLRTYTVHHRVSKIECFSLIALLVLSATVIFLIPSSREATDAMLKPGSLWLSFWPAAVGTGLSASVWLWSRRTGRSIPWRIPAGDLLLPVEWLMGVGSRLALALKDHAASVFQTNLKKEKECSNQMGPKRIETWEAFLSRWNTASLIFASIICALLFALGRP
jgi:hydrogenase-4 component B